MYLRGITMYLICQICKNQFFHPYEKKTCSKQCRKELVCSQYNSNIIVENIIQKITLEKICNLIEKEFHTPSMIYDLATRDFGLNKNEISLKSFRSKLNRSVKCDFIRSQKQPQWFKLQYKYPTNITKEEMIQDILIKSRDGQQKSTILRRERKNYGLNFQIKNSPLCVQFYTSRGFSEEYAKEKIAKIKLSGALAALKNKKFKNELIFENYLKDNMIKYKHQFCLKLLPEEKVFNKRSYIYDFYLPEKNCLVECNGLYWHASPEIYKSGDIIKLPRWGEVKVDFIWELDAFKKQTALSRGFNYKVIWENETDFSL